MQPLSQTPGSLDLTTSPRRSVLASDLALSEGSSAVSSLETMSDPYARPSTSTEISAQPRPQSTETGIANMDFTSEPSASSDPSFVAMDMTPRRPSLQSHPSSGSGATEYSITGDSPVRPGPRSNSVQSSATGSLDVLSVGPSQSSSETPGHSQSTGLSQSLPESDSSLLDNMRNETRSLDLSTSGSSQATVSTEELGSLDLTKASSVSSNQLSVTTATDPPPYYSTMASSSMETSEQPSTSRNIVPVDSSRSRPPFFPPLASTSVETPEQPSTSRTSVPVESSRSSSSIGQPDANTAIVDMDLVGANENVANTVVIETSHGPSGSNR